MISKITGNKTVPIFKAKILGKHDVQYYECEETGFIQTEEPFWLDEAYSAAISSLDVGYVSRNQSMAKRTTKIIETWFDGNKSFLDYGAGYGMFVRLMRDRGFDFHWSDKHCENLFAVEFANSDAVSDWELITAFEVFEHLPSPLEELEQMFALSDNILFSTSLRPNKPLKSVDDWWYFVPEAGQHVSIYTEKALRALADRFDANLFTDGHSLHLFSRRGNVSNPFPNPKLKLLGRVLNRMRTYRPFSNRKSFREKDYLTVLDRIRERQKNVQNS